MRRTATAVILAVLAAAPADASEPAALVPLGAEPAAMGATVAGATVLWFDRLDGGRTLRVWSSGAGDGTPRLLATAGPAQFLAWAQIRASRTRTVVLTELRREASDADYGLLAGRPGGPLRSVASFRARRTGTSLPLQDVSGTRMLVFESSGAGRVRAVVRTADARGRRLGAGPSWPVSTRGAPTPPVQGRLAGSRFALLRRGDPATITVYDARSGRRRWSFPLPPSHAPSVPGNYVWDHWIAWDLAADGTVWAAVARDWPAWTATVAGFATAERPRLHRIDVDGVIIGVDDRDLWSSGPGAVALVRRDAGGEVRRLVALSRDGRATALSPEASATAGGVVTTDGTRALALVADVAGARCGWLTGIPFSVPPSPAACP